MHYFRQLTQRAVRVAPFVCLRPLISGHLVSVFGHYVADHPSPFTKHLFRSPNIDEFREQLRWMKKQFRFLDLDEVIDIQRSGKAFPEKSAFLSFDDGQCEMHDIVAPILLEEQIPCTFFLLSSCIDNKFLIYPHRRSYLLEMLLSGGDVLFPECVNMNAFEKIPREELIAKLQGMRGRTEDEKLEIDSIADRLGVSWASVLENHKPYLSVEQCQSLQASGFNLGSHGIDHSKFDLLSEAERQQQLLKSVDQICETFGLDWVSFSFPNSTSGVSTEWMMDMMGRDDRIRMYFGTGKMKPGAPHLINRITFDSSLSDSNDFSIKGKITNAVGARLASQLVRS